MKCNKCNKTLFKYEGYDGSVVGRYLCTDSKCEYNLRQNESNRQKHSD